MAQYGDNIFLYERKNHTTETYICARLLKILIKASPKWR
jgi:hypothetical protein